MQIKNTFKELTLQNRILNYYLTEILELVTSEFNLIKFKKACCTGLM